MPNRRHRRTGPKQVLAFCTVALLLVLGETAAAQTVARLDVTTQPLQLRAATGGRSPIWSVARDAPVALRVDAVLADGSKRDVTRLPGTTYTSLAPQLATVSADGVVSFAEASRGTAVAVRIEYAGHSVLVGFDVGP